MTPYDALLRDVADHPCEHWRKHVLADWLTEQDRDDEAEAWRWLAAWERVPAPRGWYPARLSTTSRAKAMLPFPDSSNWMGTVYRDINDPREAYLAAVADYLKHRAAGWRPEWPEGVKESL